MLSPCCLKMWDLFCSSKAHLLIAILSLSIRMPGIGDLPIFVDEAVNIATSASPSIAKEVDPFGQGRLLLQYEFVLPCMFPVQTVPICSRQSVRIFVSVCSTLTALLLFSVGRVMIGTLGAWISTFLYLFCPLIWVHDRLALQDPFSGLFATLALFFGFYAQYRFSRGNALGYFVTFGMGVALGLGILNKISFILNLPWLIAILIANYRTNTKASSLSHLSYLIAVSGLAFTIAPVLLDFNEFGSNLKYFSHPPILPLPFLSSEAWTLFSNSLVGSLQRLVWFHLDYNGFGYIILFLGCLIYSFKFFPDQFPFRLGILCSIVISTVAYTSRSYGRYYYPEMIPQFLLIGLVVSRLRTRPLIHRSIAYACTTLVAVSWTATRLSIISDTPSRLLAPKEGSRSGDYEQYVSGWYSGVGVNQIFEAIEQLRSTSLDLIYIFTSSTHSPGTRGLQFYYDRSPNIVIVQVPFSTELAPEIIGSLLSRNLEGSAKAARFLFLDQPGDSEQKIPLQERLEQLGIYVVERTTIPRSENFLFRLWEVTSIDMSTLIKTLPSQDIVLGGDGGPKLHRVYQSLSPTSLIEVSGYLDPQLSDRAASLDVSVDGIKVTNERLEQQFDIAVPISLGPGSHRIDLTIDRWLLQRNPHDLRTGYRNLLRGSGMTLEKFLVQ